MRRSTPYKVLGATGALLAAVWVGVMIADGPTTKTAEVSQEQVDEFQNGQWGETSPMETNNGFKANGYGTPDWEPELREWGTATESMDYIDGLSKDWTLYLSDAKKVEVCWTYQDFPGELKRELGWDAQERGGWVHPGDLEDWLDGVCSNYP